MTAAALVVESPEVATLERRLNAAIGRGRLLQAYACYYLQDGWCAGEAGEVGERRWVAGFFSWADRYVGAVPLGSVARGGVSHSRWRVPPGYAEVEPGERMVTRTWRHGRVVSESVRPVGVAARARHARAALAARACRG